MNLNETISELLGEDDIKTLTLGKTERGSLYLQTIQVVKTGDADNFSNIVHQVVADTPVDLFTRTMVLCVSMRRRVGGPDLKIS